MPTKTLEALSISLPLINNMLGVDAQLCLCDREKVIAVSYADTFRMDIEVGQKLDANRPGDDMLIKAILTGEGNSGILPEFVYGVTVDGIVTPILEDGEVVGVVTAAVSIKERKEIEYAAENLNRNLISSHQIVNEVTKGVVDLAEKLDKVKMFSLEVEELAKATESIVKKIDDNADTSHILAINAAIEAARAGNEGLGFSVIAQEMGKLAQASGESTKSIENHLNTMFERLESITLEIKNAANISIDQAAAMEEIVATLEDISTDSNKLEEIAKIE